MVKARHSGPWSQKNPWQAVVKQRTSNRETTPRWQEIDAVRLRESKLDPEWRIFARSSSDDKGPIMMFLTAFDALKAAGMEPAINVKVLVDSEEEKGSPAIGVVATEHKTLLRADGIVINDGPLHISNQPTIVFGNRGITVVRLTVYGAKSNLHSGHYGNYVPNPAQRLASLLASMKDDDGRVTIAGYYDTVKLTDAERKIMADVPDDENEIKQRVGIAKPEPSVTISRRHCNILLLTSAAWNLRRSREGRQYHTEPGGGRTRPPHHAGREPGLFWRD